LHPAPSIGLINLLPKDHKPRSKEFARDFDKPRRIGSKLFGFLFRVLEQRLHKRWLFNRVQPAQPRMKSLR
ncbi:MAG TPA: hypothetical protein DDZ82_01605, partial [Rhodobacteraceae bacterium]|nr:hypothetical protein [Paracoccaceae bacterium]